MVSLLDSLSRVEDSRSVVSSDLVLSVSVGGSSDKLRVSVELDWLESGRVVGSNRRANAEYSRLECSGDSQGVLHGDGSWADVQAVALVVRDPV